MKLDISKERCPQSLCKCLGLDRRAPFIYLGGDYVRAATDYAVYWNGSSPCANGCAMNEDLENLMQAEDRDRVHQQDAVGRVLHLLRLQTQESPLTRMIERKDALGKLHRDSI